MDDAPWDDDEVKSTPAVVSRLCRCEIPDIVCGPTGKRCRNCQIAIDETDFKTEEAQEQPEGGIKLTANHLHNDIRNLLWNCREVLGVRDEKSIEGIMAMFATVCANEKKRRSDPGATAQGRRGPRGDINKAILIRCINRRTSIPIMTIEHRMGLTIEARKTNKAATIFAAAMKGMSSDPTPIDAACRFYFEIVSIIRDRDPVMFSTENIIRGMIISLYLSRIGGGPSFDGGSRATGVVCIVRRLLVGPISVNAFATAIDNYRCMVTISNAVRDIQRVAGDRLCAFLMHGTGLTDELIRVAIDQYRMVGRADPGVLETRIPALIRPGAPLIPDMTEETYMAAMTIGKARC